MNWDKAFLNASKEASAKTRQEALRRLSLPSAMDVSAKGGATVEEVWWTDMLDSERSNAAECGSVSPRTMSSGFDTVMPAQTRRWSATQISTHDRVAIKRRKVGKFIGLVGMHTPIEEVEGRIRWCLERAIRVAREESRQIQERELAGRKV